MSAPKRQLLTATDGFTLGVDMVREMKAIAAQSWPESEPCAIEQKYREAGTSQRNVVAEYLSRIRSTGNVEIERGFASFLTEYIKSCVDGGVPDLEIYEEIAAIEAI